jgi:hypothetical protein
MRSRIRLGLALALALFCARNAAAHDYWDQATDQDDSPATDNQLIHGSVQQHDLQASAGPAADVDFYGFKSSFYSSYEAVIDSMSGDLDLIGDDTNFNRLDSSGTTVLQISEEADHESILVASTARALRWVNGLTAEYQVLRVQSASCGTTCGPEDQYRIRFFNTTIAVPRFNNSGGQFTVLIIQNPTGWNRHITGIVNFWRAADGGFLGQVPFDLDAKAALVLNTAAVAGPAGQSGTITIAHDGGYGNLAVKAVAIEPTTGFSFDSPGLYKPY